MDTPTRIGLGGTALFTLAGAAASIVPWSVSAPLMAIFAIVAAWGFLPIARNQRWPSFGMISLNDAARVGYETAEKHGFLDLVSSTSEANPLTKLEWFSYSYMTDDNVAFYGKRLPSTKSRLIDRNELRHLRPINGTSRLVSDFASQRTTFADVKISRRDMRKHLKRLSKSAKAAL